MLFNGGVFKADRCATGCSACSAPGRSPRRPTPARELAGADLDLAVARGAAYYGLVKRGKGVRIRGGTARAYYVGVETNMPGGAGLRAADQGDLRRPVRHGGGHRGRHPELRVRACVIGEEAEFRFLGSTVRRDDAAGTVVEDWEGQIDELAPVKTTLEGKGAAAAGGAGPPAQQGDAGRPTGIVAAIAATASRSGSWSSTCARGSKNRRAIMNPFHGGSPLIDCAPIRGLNRAP